jgi:hypothetical protein
VKTLNKRRPNHLRTLLVTVSTLAAPMAFADGAAVGLGLNAYGMPGLVEMPTAESLPDAQIAATIAGSSSQRMVTLTFQAAPRLTGAFRYGRFDGVRDFILYDRSFDLQYRLLDATGPWPALAIGLRDMVGTAVNSSEYLVATKTLGAGVTATVGLGWGRMGSHGGVANPLGWDTRVMDVGLGGTPDSGAWFHGPMATFGGLDWQANATTRLTIEYSSDAHQEEVDRGVVDYRSPINVGLNYAASPGVVVGAQVLHGSMIAANVTLTFNPKTPPAGGDRSPAPAPFADGSETTTDFATLSKTIERDLRAEGITLVGLTLSGDTAVLQVENTRHPLVAQMIGRTARVLAADLPANIKIFAVEPTAQGMPVARVSLERDSLQALEYNADQAALGLAAATFSPAEMGADLDLGQTPPFSWGVTPYISLSLFDPESPLRGDVGLQSTAKYAFSPNLSISGAVRLKVAGNAGSSDRASGSVLPHVRSDALFYAQEGASGLENLTVDHFGKIGPELFTHISAGYLEPMFAGVMTEVLWQPVASRLSLGAEVGHVMQRDTDKLFGVQDYNYQVTLGHLSAFYNLNHGYQVQVDAGRYLAGDWGSTLTVSRAFDNGWKVGVFATKTDVSYEDFGEGSFDKGFVITAPLAWITGQHSTTAAHVTLRPILRDGGAQLDIRNRLHDLLQGYGRGTMAATWGTFWR